MRARVPTAIVLVSILAGASSVRPAEDSAIPSGPERVEVNLVLIDVVVRDRKGRPVQGLELADFKLRVDGRVVRADEIASFEELCPEVPPTPEVMPAEPAPSSAVSPGITAAHLLVYFDFTQTTFTGRQLALSTARKFLEGRADTWPPTMIMAFSGGEPDIIQPFTTDASLLAERFDDLLEDRTTVDLDLVDELDKLKAVDTAPMPARLYLARRYALEERERARASLVALGEALGALDGLNGRKAIVLFTDVLRAEPGIQYLAQAGTTPFAQGIHIDDEVQALAREANALGVSFYDVHAGGLQVGTEDTIRFTGMAAMRLARFVRVGIDSAIGFQSTLSIETGGKALHNSNDPGAILGSAESDLSCYYILGYRYESRGPGARHDIKVKVDPHEKGKHRHGLQVRHRPYFMDRPHGCRSPDAALNPAIRTSQTHLLRAAGVFRQSPGLRGKEELSVRKSRSTEERIAESLCHAEAGAPVGGICASTFLQR